MRDSVPSPQSTDDNPSGVTAMNGNSQTVTMTHGNLTVIATICILFAALTSTMTMGIAVYLVLTLGSVEGSLLKVTQQVDLVRIWQENIDRRVDHLEKDE